MKKLIIFLIRKKLKLRKKEMFRFINQNSGDDIYYFDSDELIEMKFRNDKYYKRPSNIGLNWLLSNRCEVEGVR